MRRRGRDTRQRRPVITLATLPLRLGSNGPDVADLQRRLGAAGFTTTDESGLYGDSTQLAVVEFQRAAGLDDDGNCGQETWYALVEAAHKLGTRLLCLRSPMMRGDDVSELQLRLGALGFDAGRVDGILGPTTQLAIGDFQRNAGLVSDRVCGPETIDALVRLEGRAGSATVAGVRERDRLRRRSRALADLKVAVGMVAEMHPIATGLVSTLHQAGASTLLLDSEWSDQAVATNEFDADLYLALLIDEESVVDVSYFSVPGYESDGGRHLAELIVRELPATPGWGVGSVRGRRSQILRETRPPAVVVRLGGTTLTASQDLVVASLQRAIASWGSDPC